MNLWDLIGTSGAGGGAGAAGMKRPELDEGAMFERRLKSPPFLRGAELLGILQTGKVFSGRELAEKLGVDLRTVQRYIVELRELGFNIEMSPGQYGGYRMRRGAKMPPIVFSGEELEILLVALTALSHPSDSYFKRATALSSRVKALIPAEDLSPIEAQTRVRFREVLEMWQKASKSEG